MARQRGGGKPTKGTAGGSRPAGSRGRPPKFGRPSQVVALTLPEDVLGALRTLHRDPAWAIVQLVETMLGAPRRGQRPPAPATIAELAHLPGKRGLIVVQPQVFTRFPGVSTISLADGRAFLAFDHGAGLADLEVAIQDKLEAAAPSDVGRKQLTELLEVVRGWRRDRKLAFRTKSIIVVETAGGVVRRPLTRLREITRPSDAGDRA
jgi:hypothetical protein